MSTPTKCSNSGSQREPSERKRILPKTESEIWAMVTKRRSFSATRNPIAVAALARTRFFHVKNMASREYIVYIPMPFANSSISAANRRRKTSDQGMGRLKKRTRHIICTMKTKGMEKPLIRKERRKDIFGEDFGEELPNPGCKRLFRKEPLILEIFCSDIEENRPGQPEERSRIEVIGCRPGGALDGEDDKGEGGDEADNMDIGKILGRRGTRLPQLRRRWK